MRGNGSAGSRRRRGVAIVRVTVRAPGALERTVTRTGPGRTGAIARLGGVSRTVTVPARVSERWTPCRPVARERDAEVARGAAADGQHERLPGAQGALPRPSDRDPRRRGLGRGRDALDRVVHPRGRVLVEAVLVRPRERAPAVGQREQGEPFGVAQPAAEALAFDDRVPGHRREPHVAVRPRHRDAAVRRDRGLQRRQRADDGQTGAEASGREGCFGAGTITTGGLNPVAPSRIAAPVVPSSSSCHATTVRPSAPNATAIWSALTGSCGSVSGCGAPKPPPRGRSST